MSKIYYIPYFLKWRENKGHAKLGYAVFKFCLINKGIVQGCKTKAREQVCNPVIAATLVALYVLCWTLGGSGLF
jgi:hypothetical protein